MTADARWPRSFDIFCKVIDNYGDIGVCWRLAVQLVRRPEKFSVRLWVDDLQRFKALVARVDPAQARQCVDGIDIIHWSGHAFDDRPHDVVIEAFACDPPAAFLARLDTQVWINLEYLSAEDWVENCHCLVSPQHHGLKKHFFFPGFTPATGGLLREPDLLSRRDAWLAEPARRWRLLQSLGLAAEAIDALQRGARQVFLFCYPHAPVADLLQALASSHERTIVLMPGNGAAPPRKDPPAGVSLHGIPFVEQQAFDALLWGSDLNCVRGEDSLVRGLWAGRPLLWHIYPQEENTHLRKLDAWLARSPYPAAAQSAIRAWNAPASSGRLADLTAGMTGKQWRLWRQGADQWKADLSAQTDLVSSLLAAARTMRTA